MSSNFCIFRLQSASIRQIRFFVLTLTFSTLYVTGCSNSVGPLPLKGKDPRSYTWTIDTLYYVPSDGSSGQTIINSLCGLNDTLIYAVGYDAYQGRAGMWKYNGKTWARVYLRQEDGGLIPYQFTLYAMKEFSSSNIYAFGSYRSNFTGPMLYYALGIHYDGSQWTTTIDKLPGEFIGSCVALSPEFMYCGGRNGLLYKFDRMQWTADTIAYTVAPTYSSYNHVVTITNDSSIYIHGILYSNNAGKDKYYFFKYKDRHVTPIDSSINLPSWGGYSFWVSDLGNIYSCGVGGVYRLSNNHWNNFYSTDKLLSIYGTDDNHIFAFGYGDLYFYDGSGWSIIHSVNNYKMIDSHIWCSDNEVFVEFVDANKSYILHGK